MPTRHKTQLILEIDFSQNEQMRVNETCTKISAIVFWYLDLKNEVFFKQQLINTQLDLTVSGRVWLWNNIYMNLWINQLLFNFKLSLKRDQKYEFLRH